MTVLLKEAFAKASMLPETIQDEIAKELLTELEVEIHEPKISEPLAYPQARLDKAAGGENNIKKDAVWLQNNSDKYKGKWIALNNGILVSAHESRIELHRSLKQAGKLAGVMFCRIDN